jgi:hypothetical protein
MMSRAGASSKVPDPDPKPSCSLMLCGQGLELLERSGACIAVSTDLEDTVGGQHLQD